MNRYKPLKVFKSSKFPEYSCVSKQSKSGKNCKTPKNSSCRTA